MYSEKGNLSEVLCKPKIMPIKSLTLEKLEQLEKEAAEATTRANEEAAAAAAAPMAGAGGVADRK